MSWKRRTSQCKDTVINPLPLPLLSRFARDWFFARYLKLPVCVILVHIPQHDRLVEFLVFPLKPYCPTSIYFWAPVYSIVPSFVLLQDLLFYLLARFQLLLLCDCTCSATTEKKDLICCSGSNSNEPQLKYWPYEDHVQWTQSEVLSRRYQTNATLTYSLFTGNWLRWWALAAPFTDGATANHHHWPYKWMANWPSINLDTLNSHETLFSLIQLPFCLLSPRHPISF